MTGRGCTLRDVSLLGRTSVRVQGRSLNDYSISLSSSLVTATEIAIQVVLERLKEVIEETRAMAAFEGEEAVEM